MQTTYFPNETRGTAEYGWLKAKYSFSFSQFYDPERTQFGRLRVLNDDIIQPGKGFGAHPHNNMEIISIPLAGKLAHKDSLGHESIIHTGEVQVMSAGSGIEHSEYNASDTEIVNLLQIWVFPKFANVEPRYDQKKFDLESKKNEFITVVSPKNEVEGALWIHQDAYFNLAQLEENKTLTYTLKNSNHLIYIFVIEGVAEAAKQILKTKDALGVSEIDSIEIKPLEASKILLIEVPK